MLTDHYPVFGLRIRTPRLELRLADLDLLAALADVANLGVHDPADMPFSVPWTDWQPTVRGRAVITYNLGLIARATPADWSLPLAVIVAGEPVGLQEIGAREFATMREVTTGSWLGQRFHRRGIGTEMRAAVLALAFEGLDAAYAVSSARDTNAGSNGVSAKLGYQHDGIERQPIRGEATTFHRLRLSRAAWAAHRTVAVTINGLDDACRTMLGADAPQ